MTTWAHSQVDLISDTDLPASFKTNYLRLQKDRSVSLAVKDSMWLDSLKLQRGSLEWSAIQLGAAGKLREVDNCQRAIVILEDIESSWKTADIPDLFYMALYRERGLNYGTVMLLDQAFVEFEKAKEFAAKLGDPEYEGMVWVDLAELCRKAGTSRGEAGFDYLRKAEALVDEGKLSDRMLAEYHNRKAALLFQFGTPGEVEGDIIHHSKVAIEFAQKAGDRYTEAVSLNEMALILGKDHDSTAVGMYHKAIKIFDELDAVGYQALAMTNLARYYFQVQDEQNGLRCLQEATVALKGKRWRYVSSSVHWLFYHYYQEYENQTDSALYYFQRFHDDWREDNLARERDRTSLSMALSKKKELMASIAIRDQELAEEAENQKRLIFGLVGLGILVLIFAWLMLQLRKANAKTKKNAEMLESANKELEASIEVQKMLVSEIHHRVKNNLQVTGNILQAQADRSGTDDVAEELEGAKARLVGMAVIQDLLYTEKQAGSFELDTFLREFGNHTLQTMGPVNSRLDIECEGVESTQTDAVQLAIIFQELITNSCKYAVKEGQDLKLRLNVKPNGAGIVFEYNDNGPGIQQGVAPSGTGLGSYIIDAMIRQLRGKIQADTNSILKFSYAHGIN